MCAAVNSNLLIFLIIQAATQSLVVYTEGLPSPQLLLSRSERGVDDDDLISGKDFLSIFMGSSGLRRQYKHDRTWTTTTTTPTTTKPSITTKRTSSRAPAPEASNHSSAIAPATSAMIRDTRSTATTTSTTIAEDLISANSDDRVSDNNVRGDDAPIYPANEHRALLADSNKSEFGVDEGEPTITGEQIEYPASIRQLTGPTKRVHLRPIDGSGSGSGSDADLIARHLTRDNIKDRLQPYHETIIYHDDNSGDRARSVSYSSVVQSVPIERQTGNNNNNKVWNIGRKTYEELNKYEEPQRGTGNDADDRKRPLIYGRAEENYEVDEAVSVMSDGRIHGVQSAQPRRHQDKLQLKSAATPATSATTSTTTDEVGATTTATKVDNKKDDNQKVGYVVEGRNYRKYRVEERTSDGFIVGEYGVLSHDDGSLRGVRYTADGATHPRVIYDALMKFLSL